MQNINSVTIQGNLGKDPETRSTQNGKEVTTLSVATTRSYKDKKSGEWVKEPTQWHTVVMWGGVLNLKKGDCVLVKGSLNYRSYEDKAGVKKFITEIKAFEVNLAEEKTETEPEGRF